nr:hypothetical protein [uncultured Oscillibacter sp.]
MIDLSGKIRGIKNRVSRQMKKITAVIPQGRKAVLARRRNTSPCFPSR